MTAINGGRAPLHEDHPQSTAPLYHLHVQTQQPGSIKANELPCHALCVAPVQTSMAAGTKVEAVGLLNSPQYNGMQGICTGEREGDRWTVKLSNGEFKKIREANLLWK